MKPRVYVPHRLPESVEQRIDAECRLSVHREPGLASRVELLRALDDVEGLLCFNVVTIDGEVFVSDLLDRDFFLSP